MEENGRQWTTRMEMEVSVMGTFVGVINGCCTDMRFLAAESRFKVFLCVQIKKKMLKQP